MTSSRSIAALALAFLAACRAPEFADPHASPSANASTTVSPPPTPTPVVAARRATARRASGDVEVRLTDFDGASHIEVAGCAASDVIVERRGRGVALRNGPVQLEIEIEAAAGQRGLRLGEHTYPGRLLVRARAAGGLEVSNLVDLELYVTGVLPAEIVVWSALPEELRTQAIAARSYAVAALDERGRKTNSPYLFDDARDQAYGGRLDERSAKARAVATRVAAAVEATRGVVLVEGERVVDARFHAACGGDTADGPSVFPELDFDCMHSVACAPCRGELGVAREANSSANGDWTWTASRAQLDALAQRWSLGPHVERVKPAKCDAAGRWLEVEVAGSARTKRAPFEELRRALGDGHLLSSRIARTQPAAGEPISSGLAFEGRGRGHGVGLCQVGMRGYARAGWTAEKILAHYYPGARTVDLR